MNHIALVSLSPRVNFEQLAKVAGAVQRQVLEHAVQAGWSIAASVTAYPNPTDVPSVYHRVTIVTNHPNGQMGVHLTQDSKNQPCAFVSDDGEWSITVSHEVLEMLVDPSFNTLVGGTFRGEPVQFLKEICDPVQGAHYPLNEVLVSDFVFPEYYDASAPAGRQYSFCKSVLGPLKVAERGALVWVDHDSEFWSYVNNGPGSREQRIGKFSGGIGAMTLRSWVDSAIRRKGCAPEGKDAKKLADLCHRQRCANHAAGQRWLQDFQELFPDLVPDELVAAADAARPRRKKRK